MNNEQQTEHDLMFWVAVLVQLLGVTVLFVIFGSFIGLPLILLAGLKPMWPILISLTLAIIGWALILFKSPMFEWWFIYTQPNHRRVLANQIVRDKLAENINARLEIKELTSMREIGSGWRGKWPTEYRVGGPINMKSEIVVGTGPEPLTVYTAKGENIGLAVRWQLTTTPLPGYLVILIRQSEEAILSNLRAEGDQFFIQTIRTMKESEVFEVSTDPKDKGKSLLAVRFEKLHGGDNVVSTRETEIGVTTKKLMLLSIDRTKSYQESAEGLASAKNIGQIMKTLRRNLGDKATALRPDVLLLMANVIAGKVKNFNPLMITGLDNVDPKALAALLAQTRQTT